VQQIPWQHPLGPCIPIGYAELVRALEGLGAFEQALASYQPLLQRLRQGDWQGAPELEPEILAQKGKTHRLLSQYAEAIEHFRAYEEVGDRGEYGQSQWSHGTPRAA
jgi:hypothetical protein